MKRRTERTARRQALKQSKEAAQHTPSGNSRYGRKSAYLAKHGGWGFEYTAPKPWF